MGRAKNQVSAIAPMLASQSGRSRIGRVARGLSVSPGAHLLASLQRKLQDVSFEGVSQEEFDALRYKQLGGYLSDEQNKLLISFYHNCSDRLYEAMDGDEEVPENIRHAMQTMAYEAKEMVVIALHAFNIHMLKTDLAKLEARLAERDYQHLREIAYQTLRAATLKSIEQFDPYEGTKFTSFISQRMEWDLRDATKEEGDGGLNYTKGDAGDFVVRIRGAVAKLRRERGDDTPLSLEEIVEMTDVPEDKAAIMLPQVAARAPYQLDAPIRHQNDDGSVNFFASLQDTARFSGLLHPGAEDEFMSESEPAGRISRALSSLNPYHKRIAEFAFEDGVQQKDLYAGVYIDDEGRVMTAETTVANQWEEESDIPVQRVKQSELNMMFRQGRARWQPLNPVTAELSMLLAQKQGDNAAMEKTGVPITSGNIQYELEGITEHLAKSPEFKDEQVRYRGADEIENSQQARQELVKALQTAGVPIDHKMSNVKLKKLLQEQAQSRGWTNADGSLLWNKICNQS